MTATRSFLAWLAAAGLLFSLISATEGAHDTQLDASGAGIGKGAVNMIGKTQSKTFHKYPYGHVVIETTTTSDDSSDTETFKFFPDPNLGNFIKNVMSMMLLKLLCGVDDLALLTALVGTKNAKQNNVNCILYLSFIAFVGVAAWLVAQTTYLLLDNLLGEGFWNVERVSSLVFGTILLLFGVKEWYEGDDDDEDEINAIKDLERNSQYRCATAEKINDDSEKEPLSPGDHRETGKITSDGRQEAVALDHARDNTTHVEGEDHDIFYPAKDAQPAVPHVRDEPKVQNWSAYRYAGLIGMLALDDSVVFTCMIQGSEISLVEVMMGMIMGSMLIVGLCRLLSSIHVVNDLLQKVPKWVLICGLGAWVAVGGLLDIGI